MSFYVNFKIDYICSLIQQLIERCEELYSILEKGNGRFLVMNPDEMDSAVQHIFNICKESFEKLRFIDSQLDNSPFSYKEETQVLWHNQFLAYFNEMEYMFDLRRYFSEAYEKYTLSGASGNPANISGLIQWQGIFCDRCPGMMVVCKKMIDCLSYVEQEDIRRKDSRPMACVYASPERMSGNEFSETVTDVYPFIHSVTTNDDFTKRNEIDSEPTGQFCSRCGKFISMSGAFCPYCGNNTQTVISNKPEILMGPVYASPGMMRKKQSNIFSKLFKRKK